MAKYISEFRAINGITYKIEITTEKGSGTINFKLGGTPFTTEMESDGKTIYAPIKSTAATITMLTDKMPFNLYSGKITGNKVVLTNTTDNVVEWIGYITPCVYDMGFDNKWEEVELECVDGIAALKEIPYRTQQQQIDTFLNIIFKCLKRVDCYKYLYVNDNVQFTANGTENILSKLRISENNFYDEKDYELQNDDDVAWKCYDVLFEIMQYMGYSLTVDGDSVYILDYDAIVKGRTRFFRYDITGNVISNATIVTLKQSYFIESGSYAQNGTSISLDEVFNKVVVKDEFYTIDDLIDGVDNSKNLTNITANYDSQLKEWFKTSSRFLESEVFTVKNKLGEDESFFVTLTKDNDGQIFFVLGKFYQNTLITTNHYLHINNMEVTNLNNPMMYSKLWETKGANYVGYFVAAIDNDKYNLWRADIVTNWDGQTKEKKLEQFGLLTNIANIQNKNLTNYILCLNQDTNHIEHDNVKDYPFFTIRKTIPTIFGGNGGYLVIKGTLIRHMQYNTPFPNQGKQSIHKDTTKTSIYANEGYVWARLKWGDYYWRCEGDYKATGEWVKEPSYFKIFYGDPTQEVKVEKWNDTDLPFYNNCGALWGVDENGYYIPTPPDGNLIGEVQFTMYANKDTKGKWARNGHLDKKNSYKGYHPAVMLFKGLEIKVGYSDDAMNDDAAKSDTYYSCDNSTYDNMNEMDEITYKICTYDNKNPSYSTVDYLDNNGKSQYLDNTYNLATGNYLRQEHQYVVKLVSQYQEPRVLFECNLHNDLDIKPWCLLTDKTINDRKFIVETASKDYKRNMVNLQIKEKTDKYNEIN